jgi:hypothetical protein
MMLLRRLRDFARAAAGGSPAKHLHGPPAERKHEQADDEEREKETTLHVFEVTRRAAVRTSAVGTILSPPQG